ncbi:MAG: hypothetical protein R6V75_04920 [Bacteroidales bacterium]
MRCLFLLLSVMLLAPFDLNGQNKYIPVDPYTGWDGITHRSRYMILAPAYLGPNALPVPELHQGRVPERINWTGLFETYFSQGDLTYNFLTNLVVPLAKGMVGLEFRYVPVEYYRMDRSVSRLRRTFSGEAVEGFSAGDIYFGTIVQVLKDHRYLPDLAFAMACRTASGTSRQDARFTDTPGYHLDLSAGKTIKTGQSRLESIRLYGEVGFYVYQTLLDNYPQNDALLYGMGIDFSLNQFFFSQSLRGYSGYMHNGDHPLVYKAEIGLKFGTAGLVVGYEKGIRDYPFNSIKAGFRLNGLTDGGI